jgi:hypothetical protein
MGNHEEETASSKTEKYFFCGNHHHPRTLGPAKEGICRLCSKKGHYQRGPINLLKIVLQQIMMASASAIAPRCLQRSVVKGKVNGVDLNALINKAVL